ncbi:MAG: SDR family NAD(P)-dependent oxidoreductase [Ignavibacteriaceae bacterium]|nr:SDR family NAD(P)-dependent oxidoreductase [Ignavibacteriaceae bacterium]
MSKVVWVTGASSGIGSSLVEQFAKEGFKVYASARRIDLLNELKSKIVSQFNSEIVIDVCDNSDIKSINKFYSNHFADKNLNILVNNAGTSSFKPVNEDSYEEIQKVINTNLLGAVFTIKEVLPGFIFQKSGTIVNILSVTINKTFTNSSIYAASKAGLYAYSKVLREENRKNGIRVLDVFPGATISEIWDSKIIDKYGIRMMNPADVAESIVKNITDNSVLAVEELHLRPVSGDL